MSLILGTALFAVIFLGPYMVFGWYMIHRKGRLYRDLIPYTVLYVTALGLFFAWGSGLRDWDLVVIGSIAAAGTWIVARAYAGLEKTDDQRALMAKISQKVGVVRP